MRFYPLYWCKKCNVPLIKESCDIHGQGGDAIFNVKITPPGNIKPLFTKEGNKLRNLIDEVYGEGLGSKLIPKNRIVLLNKVPHADLAYEVIVDGRVLGVWRYDVEEGHWSFLPHMEGARRLAALRAKKWVMVDEGAEKAIAREGKNLLAPGIIDYDQEIKEGDYVFVINEEWKAIATGKVLSNFKDKILRRRGAVVKVKHFDEPRNAEFIDKEATWDDVLKANMKALIEKEEKAIKFIREVCEKTNKPVLISFSGGKDSLAVLLLARKALNSIGKDFYIIFTNTGVEYPETDNYVKHIISDLNLSHKLIEIKPSIDFFSAVKIFGPPARDLRWCCKVCKLAPLAKFIKEIGGECVTLIGLRGIESAKRKKQGAIWKSFWVKGQIGASPIYEWSTLDVWLYLIKEGVEINPLYYEGLERVGCWVCPSMDLAEMETAKELIGKMWEEYMDLIKRNLRLTDHEMKKGLWRWRFKWPDWMGEGRKRSLRDLKLEIYDMLSSRGFKFGIKKNAFKRFISILKTAYDVHIGEDCILMSQDGVTISKICIHEDNRDVIMKFMGSKKSLLEIFRFLARATLCIKCGLCMSICPYGAIRPLEGQGVEILEDKCTSCGECNSLCPIWVYSLKTTNIAKKLLE